MTRQGTLQQLHAKLGWWGASSGSAPRFKSRWSEIHAAEEAAAFLAVLSSGVCNKGHCLFWV